MVGIEEKDYTGKKLGRWKGVDCDCYGIAQTLKKGKYTAIVRQDEDAGDGSFLFEVYPSSHTNPLRRRIVAQDFAFESMREAQLAAETALAATP